MFQSKNPLKANSGFTLIELLVALAVASILMAAIAGAYWTQSQTSRDQQMVVAMQQNLRSAMYFLERDIKMAGYDGNPNDTVNATITLAAPEALTFQFVDDTDTQVTVAYDLFDSGSDGDDDLGRAVNGGARAAVAENIEELEFFYTLADGRQSTDPLNLLSPAPSLDDIRAIGISMIIRTANETHALDTRSYQSLSGATVDPYNDKFRRQVVTATIKCRNMVN